MPRQTVIFILRFMGKDLDKEEGMRVLVYNFCLSVMDKPLL